VIIVKHEKQAFLVSTIIRKWAGVRKLSIFKVARCFSVWTSDCT